LKPAHRRSATQSLKAFALVRPLMGGQGHGSAASASRSRRPRRPRRGSCALHQASAFSRTLDSVQGNARLAEASVAEEVAAALDATDKDVAIGGAGLAGAAIEVGLVDELRMFRYPVVVGGGTPFLPPVTEDVPLDLIETRTFGSRVIYERYRRAREESD
jgi:dihydrofolate reductase